MRPGARPDAGGSHCARLFTQALFLLATEFAPPAARARVSAHISYAWVSGLLFLVATAWLLRTAHWRWLLLAHVPGLLFQASRSARQG